MTYYVHAKLFCDSQAEAVAIADDLQKLLDRRTILSGTAKAQVLTSGTWGVVAHVYLSVKRDRDTFFENLQARLGQTGGPTGEILWSDCRHDEGIGLDVATRIVA